MASKRYKSEARNHAFFFKSLVGQHILINYYALSNIRIIKVALHA